ncbi:hypothetical protein D3C87_1982330 [compost metagenome]
MGNVFAHEASEHIGGYIVRRQIGQPFQNFVNDRILGEPADTQQRSPAAAKGHFPEYDVKRGTESQHLC